MSVNNIKIYNIFRKDLHLGDEKAQELISEMNEVFGKESLIIEVKELSTKLTLVDTKLDGLKANFDTMQAEMKADFKEICSKISNTGLIQYITITGTILGIIWTYFKFFK